MMNNTNANKMETFTIQELTSGKHLVKSTSSNAINIKCFKSFKRVDSGFVGDSKDTFDFLKYLWDNETFTLEKTENIVTKNKDTHHWLFDRDAAVDRPSRSSQRPPWASITSPACPTAPTQDRDLHPTKKIFSSMSFKNFGKGYLLTPDSGCSHPDWGKIGNKPDYYHGGWWRKDLGGWFFRGSFFDFLKENGAKDSSTNNAYVHKSTYTKSPLSYQLSYQEEFDTDYDFKKGKLSSQKCVGNWRGVCQVDDSFQDTADDVNSSDEEQESSVLDSINCYEDDVVESEDEDISDESDEESEGEDDFIDDEDEDEDDDYEFVNANDVYYTRYANGLIVVGDFKQCGKILEEIGGVYNKSLKGYLFKSARVKETLLDMGIQHISFRPQEN